MKSRPMMVLSVAVVQLVSVATPSFAQEGRTDGIYPHSDPLPEQEKKRQWDENVREIHEAAAAARAAQSVPLREVAIGMTKDEVMQTKGLWRYPTSKNVTQTASGIREQWVYCDVKGIPYQYLYFENGIVTTIQQER